MRNMILVATLLFCSCGSEPTVSMSDVWTMDNATDSADDIESDAGFGDANCVFPLYSECKNAADCPHETCMYVTCEMAVDHKGECAHLCVYTPADAECPDGMICWQDTCCEPHCENAWECGDDGCGGSCGECPFSSQAECVDHTCKCTPNCKSKMCGTDGCGGKCGTCKDDHICINGQCECQPDCAGKECGYDGCWGDCGQCDLDIETCAFGLCVCKKNCINKKCGDDGCGGTCGECAPDQACIDGTCGCAPKCEGKECGDNGCNGTCGLCQEGASCLNGKCVPNTEAVCNDGLDNDNDKVVDCDEKECWGVEVGTVKITITTSWYSAYQSYKWVEVLQGIDGYTLQKEAEHNQFQYEQQWDWHLSCPTNSNPNAADFWIKTDGAVLIENPMPHAITVFTKTFLDKPSCWYSWYKVPEDFIYGPFGDLCIPNSDEAGTVVGPFSQTQFASLPPDQQQVFLVRWQYYQLLPPAE